ncbi:MAG: hypothetical protein ACI4NA_03355 [Succinivibrio sp.]
MRFQKSRLNRIISRIMASAASLALAGIIAASAAAATAQSSRPASAAGPERSAPAVQVAERRFSNRRNGAEAEIPFADLMSSGTRLSTREMQSLSDIAFANGGYDALRLWDGNDFAALGRMLPRERRNYLAALSREEAIGCDVRTAAAALGGTLHKLDHRMKSPSSAYEALHGRPDSQGTMRSMKDLVRYSVIFSQGSYTASAKRMLGMLAMSGYSVASVWNAWTDKGYPYRALNVSLLSPQGARFELQFHTAQGAKVNDLTHGMYERRRLLPKDSPEYAAILRQQHELADSIAVPEGIESLPDFNHARKGA